MQEPMGVITRVTLHWTAGGYEQVFDDYHFCIRGDGRVVKTLPITVKGAHTWGRNSGNVGIALCSEAGAVAHAGPDGLRPVGSKFPTQAIQLERMALLVAELAFTQTLALTGTVNMAKIRPDRATMRMVPAGGRCQVPVVTDHGWYSVNDRYADAGAMRWDIGDFKDDVLRKAAWYLEQLRNGKRRLELLARR